ncbi:hypothetical protein A2U01_0006127, partial [Trifolium medium]|nr:hypothetical protein [Trifolium medium]
VSLMIAAMKHDHGRELDDDGRDI